MPRQAILSCREVTRRLGAVPGGVWPSPCPGGRASTRARDDDDEGRRLLRMIRRGTGSTVIWLRAQMVLLSAQGMPVSKIAEVTFTSDDRVRDVIMWPVRNSS
jgi:hypothetical protein